MFHVVYQTMNDTYTKSFSNPADAEKFCRMIKRLYPEQDPKVGIKLSTLMRGLNKKR